jgi:DNA mismatch repair protein MutL
MKHHEGRIAVLSEDLTNKIAAGEVVERPFSIVKELIENSLDAGATDIVIELQRGGKESVKVVDNGKGIGREDVMLAFERYATNKIYTFDDIYKITSFGFRGEALPSIASISRIEMTTKREEALSGTKVTVEDGKVKEAVDIGCPVGTSVFVTDIFHSVPVRRKFLKKDSTEQGHCVDVITKLAMPHPGVKMRVMANGRTILNIPRARDLAERVSLVIGRDFRENILNVEEKRETIRLKGFISSPHFTRSSTKGMLYYVNKRFISDSLSNHAVMTSYRKIIEAKRYPSVVLFLNISPDDMDVNVHPTKREVRFRNPREVYEIIVEAIAKALSGISPVSGIAPGGNYDVLQKHRGRIEDALKRYTISSGDKKTCFPPSVKKTNSLAHPSTGEKSLDEDASPAQAGMWRTSKDRKLSFSSLEYLGQAAATYLVFSSTDGIILMDQHAAHERVLFEKFRNVSPGERIVSQRLLIPEVVSLPPSEFALLVEHAGMLENAGIEVEPYGGNTVVVKSVPAILTGNIELRTMLLDITEELSKAGKPRNIEEAKDNIFRLLACKGAIKANHSLMKAEVDSLCEQLDSTPFASTCPHGRPTYIQFRIRDLERMFRRR